VIQDTRGRFASQGDWDFSFASQGPDTYDTIEWLAAQPWCSGAVGMSGGSYLGITQLLGAQLKPPHLKAIAPALAPYTPAERIETGGAVRLEQVINWLAFMSLDWLQQRIVKGESVAPNDSAMIVRAVNDAEFLLNQRPLKDIPLFKIPGFPLSFERFLEEVVTLPVDAALLSVPTLHLGGWFDLFARSTLRLFREQRELHDALANSVHLLMGPWTHAPQMPQFQGHVNFGYAASADYAGVPQVHLAFFRKYLLDEQVTLPRVRYFMMNANDWRDSQTWPPNGVIARRFHLSSGSRANTPAGNGVLIVDAAAPAMDEFVYDPGAPTPTCGGRFMAWTGRLAGPVDQTPTRERRDILCYTSEPLAEALDLAGPVNVSLTVSSSAVDTDFVAKLCDVDSAGTALSVCEGVVRMRWRKGFDAASLLEPGAHETIIIDLGDVAWRVLEGHRLRLQVQSANYPHLDNNTNTGNPIGVDKTGMKATNRVFHGTDQPSWLTLTVLPK
jgi:putative CocE/NonD family hydrolase